MRGQRRIAADNVRNLAEDVTVSERDTYPQCETALMIGQADAIAADDAIAAGLASNRGGRYLKVVGETFGDARMRSRSDPANPRLPNRSTPHCGP